MLALRGGVRTRLLSLPLRPNRLSRRDVSHAERKATTPLAKQLDATGVWNWGRWAKNGVARPKGDRNRVNIVDEKLCGRCAPTPGDAAPR